MKPLRNQMIDFGRDVVNKVGSLDLAKKLRSFWADVLGDSDACEIANKTLEGSELDMLQIYNGTDIQLLSHFSDYKSIIQQWYFLEQFKPLLTSFPSADDFKACEEIIKILKLLKDLMRDPATFVRNEMTPLSKTLIDLRFLKSALDKYTEATCDSSKTLLNKMKIDLSDIETSAGLTLTERSLSFDPRFKGAGIFDDDASTAEQFLGLKKLIDNLCKKMTTKTAEAQGESDSKEVEPKVSDFVSNFMHLIFGVCFIRNIKSPQCL
jgi:hypothetical protein